MTLQNRFKTYLNLQGASHLKNTAMIKTRHAVEHNFIIIGEAVARLPEDFRKQHKHLNWRQVKDFRNVIVNDYFGIDNNIVWDIIQLNLSDLLSDISLIIKQQDLL
jgi:uncharacterized protein with HEPN domain